MKNQKRPPYNTIPHYIVSDYRNGKLNINQLRLLQWIRAIGTPYGIAITSLVDLNNDVFPDLDLKINTINSYLIKLRQRQYIFFEPRQGKMGTFEIHLNHWLTPNMGYKTLDKFFPEPKRWVGADGEPIEIDSFPQANPPEANQKLEEQNQKLEDGKNKLAKQLSSYTPEDKIRSSHNEHDTEPHTKKHDTLLKSSFKGTLVREFNPTNHEEERCKEIASELGDEFINSIVSVLRKDGFRLIERAWGIFREHRQEGKKMDNPARYFQGIIKKLR
ncbi:hypothetical protein A2W67_01925 [Candidatus Nomurabacteria bacterium RIFCSPLOWO2_02_40_28]|uniref:Uncharacterized protein n=2 Tax=Candidatus Nomuraibacteriota TaxID=1752729 RepID=A0A837HU33_9BACT|nr:MAG: hypothetical protein UT27_C0005G0037 [Candidatus Nomurabacteria bacterium GW2011_GWD2_39_12]KKR20303.1 MAG: hypothetical protein UT51_C0005G0036 [Candidatus Nomurabacteria bacterium GW2011_GWC2_39_41]KKR36260.1 MAG: hypothetical protein UT70_C0019G0010 [Candidatus Nomurabacteria bacterium GW2011_GWE2_40_10]KKR38396.1 MAG: hypothetical protein UT73_C0003G0036 [Candidatus Nomurabacteria bacterium GW2011_GWB1_40_11]KKR39895.1 MAG: hypothetical protein UT74_C0005G0112 [Parcubacteria group b